MASVRRSCVLVAGLTGFLLAGARQGVPAAVAPPYVADPVESGSVEVAGVPLYYEIHGAGIPLLLLHGGLGSGAHFAASVPHLAERHRVILLDRRGHGRSPDIPEPFSYSAMAREVKGFLDAIQVSAVCVVGWSDGGVVGYHLASSYPETVIRLVAVGANIRVDGMSGEDVEWIRSRLTEDGIAEDFPQVKDDYLRFSPDPSGFGDFVRKTRELWLRDPYISPAEFDGIRAPVLLMAGDRKDIRLEHMIELHARLADSQLSIIPNSDHFLMEQKNALFNTIVTDFLDGR